MTSCKRLLADGWKPPAPGPDVGYDPSSGIAVVTFGPEDRYTFDLQHDEACAELPGIGARLADLAPSYEEMKAQECEATVRSILADDPPKHGDVVADLDALRAHVKEWCPPEFAAQLDAAQGD